MLLTSFFQKITCSNGAKSLTTVHKSNNIWEKKGFCDGTPFFCSTSPSSHNVSKPQEDSFKTIQFSYN